MVLIDFWWASWSSGERAIATQTALRKSTEFCVKDNKIAIALVCYELFYSGVLQAIAPTFPQQTNTNKTGIALSSALLTKIQHPELSRQSFVLWLQKFLSSPQKFLSSPQKFLLSRHKLLSSRR
jgi:hypothetical protein